MSTRRTFIQQIAAASTLSADTLSRTSAAQKAATLQRGEAIHVYKIANTDLVVSRIGYGCAGLTSWDRGPVSSDDVDKAARVVHTAYDNGVSLFDHADLYAFGKAESVFGGVLKQSPGLRNRIVIQTKCGQRFPNEWKPGDPIGVDLGREHIISSVEGSLSRLSTDHLDILLLHIPDALAETQEIARAFDDLHRSGKVRYFGVSNYNARQIQLLKKDVRQPIVVNQIHLGLAHAYPFEDGMEFTLLASKGADTERGYRPIAGGGAVNYCQLNDIQIQGWSPLRGVVNVPDSAKPERKQTARLIAALADEKGVTPSAIALAWLLRHPAGIVPIIGSVEPAHIVENCAADRVALSRDEWYSLFASTTDLDPALL